MGLQHAGQRTLHHPRLRSVSTDAAWAHIAIERAGQLGKAPGYGPDVWRQQPARPSGWGQPHRQDDLDCYPSIQAAVNAAHDGDTIRVVQGTYLEAVTIAKSVTLEGGWSPDTLHRDWNVYKTMINAHKAGSAIRTSGRISPTVEGFDLTGGDASDYLGWGGGILIDGIWTGSGLAVIRHNVITDNVACTTSSCQGYGGGIMVYSSGSIIEYNTVISNAARTGGNGSGTGGGIAIWGYPSDSMVAHNDIISNTAVFSPAGAFANGEGGGFWAEHDATLIDNELRGNVAAVKGKGLGGRAYAGGELYDNRILSNTASVNGTGLGGGVYAYYVGDFDSNRVQGNVASSYGDGTGGALYAVYLRRAQHNQVGGNTATRGGGVYFNTYTGSQAFTDNQVTRNHATGTNLGTLDGGGGIASRADWVMTVSMTTSVATAPDRPAAHTTLRAIQALPTARRATITSAWDRRWLERARMWA